MNSSPWTKRLVTCAIIISGVVCLLAAREAVAATPGLASGLPDELGTFNVGHTTMRIVGKGIWGPPADRDEVLKTLRRAPELGVDLIDTADSYGPNLAPLTGLGFLPGSNCPHYDGEAARRPTYQRLIREGMPAGIAADDGTALHFVSGELSRVVSSRASARAFRVYREGEEAREEPIQPEYLGS